MLKEGLFRKLKPEAVFGMHALGTVDVGQVHYWLGAAAASDSNFQISFHGKQAHAAFPQESIDPVVMAAEAVMELQTIRTRNIAPSDVAVLSVSTIHSGVRVNITPDLATLSGTIRTFDDKVDERIERRMGEVVQSIAQGNGGSAEMKFYDRCPALINDLGLTERSLSSLKRAAGESEVTLASPVMAGGRFCGVRDKRGDSLICGNFPPNLRRSGCPLFPRGHNIPSSRFLGSWPLDSEL